MKIPVGPNSLPVILSCLINRTKPRVGKRKKRPRLAGWLPIAQRVSDEFSLGVITLIFVRIPGKISGGDMLDEIGSIWLCDKGRDEALDCSSPIPCLDEVFVDARLRSS